MTPRHTTTEIINPSHPTRAEIAANFTLWGTFVDQSGLDTRERFDALTEAAKLAFMDDCFGPETCEDRLYRCCEGLTDAEHTARHGYPMAGHEAEGR